MDKFTIITNNAKDQDRSVTNRIYQYLIRNNKECLILDPEEEKEDRSYYHTNPEKIPEDMECVIVLGGDGTLLQAARDVLDKDIPLFGINLGTLGYLAEVDRHSIYSALDRLMSDRFTIERRMMLSGTILRGEEILAKDVALNDIVITRDGALRVMRFNNYVNDTFLNSYKADGIIVATPTGSTG